MIKFKALATSAEHLSHSGCNLQSEAQKQNWPKFLFLLHNFKNGKSVPTTDLSNLSYAFFLSLLS